MKNPIFALIITAILSASGFSAEFQEMRFTNRARCALDSKKPTERAFVLINNMDVARSLYRLAKSKGEDSTQLTQYGIRVYRQSIIKLFELIHNKIIKGELPLLPADIQDSKDSTYISLMQKCRSDESCTELDQFLRQLWNHQAKHDLNFFNPQSFRRNNRTPKLQCAYLKKFSSLESQILAPRPTPEILLEIGKAAINKNDFLAECDDDLAQENVKVASFEFSLPINHHFSWDDQGFDYWNSLKIYFSWAYRHSLEMEQLSYPFSAIFKSVEIEDSVMLTPTGCKSITMPKCEAAFLNQNAIREFAQNNFKQKAPSLDMLTPLPDGVTKNLMTSPFGEVNRDILNVAQFPKSSDWLEEFRDNFSSTKTLVRKKLRTSLTTLNLITSKLSSDHTIELVAKSVLHLSGNDDKNALYYLCSEFSYATDGQLSFIKKNLDILKKTTMLDEVNSQIVNQSSKTYFFEFEKLSTGVNQLCQSLQQGKIWDESFKLDESGFNSWYLSRAYNKNITSTFQLQQAEFLKTHSPLLAYSSFEKTKSIQDVICVNGIDCARKILGAIIDLYGATLYADTFWNLDGMIKSPDLFNPYAERTACHVYDPWFKTKSTLFSFMTDAAQAGLSLSYPGVLYAKFDLLPKEVVSFNQLVKDGKIVYDQRFDKNRINAGLAMDFGKLLNIPCGISISHSEKTNPFNYLQFQGISLRACQQNENRSIDINEQNQSTINNSPQSRCLVCSLNFETVVNVSTRSLSPVSSVFFLARALINLYKGLTDPNNIPHSWSVNPEQVKKAMLEHNGAIPKDCIYPLTHSRECAL